jgi:hypothetical protein
MENDMIVGSEPCWIQRGIKAARGKPNIRPPPLGWPLSIGKVFVVVPSDQWEVIRKIERRVLNLFVALPEKWKIGHVGDSPIFIVATKPLPMKA